MDNIKTAVRQATDLRDFLILGGGSNVAAGLKLIEELKPERVILALDRDEAGLDAKQALIRHLAAMENVELLRLDLGPCKDPAKALKAGWTDWNLVEVPRDELSFRVKYRTDPFMGPL